MMIMTCTDLMKTMHLTEEGFNQYSQTSLKKKRPLYAKPDTGA
jgi:hypothetical protein